MRIDPHRYGPGALCRMDGALVESCRSPAGAWRMAAACVAIVCVGTFAYGFVFGLWRSPLQGLYAAVKMPLLFFSIVLASAPANYLLGLVLGTPVALHHVLLCMLFGMAIAAALLGALSPVVGFLILQVPAPAPDIVGLPMENPAVAGSMRTFWGLLLFHVSVIGAAGTIGNLKLLALLRCLCDKSRMVGRLLTVWLLLCGFVGCELSWLLSPFLCKPNYPPHVITRTYFQGNFYQQVWRGIKEFL